MCVASMCVYVCSRVCVCTCVWRSEVDVTYLLPSLAILRQGLLLNLELDGLAGLVSQFVWGMLCLLCPNAGITGLPCPRSIYVGLGDLDVISQQTLYPRSLLLALPFSYFNCHSETPRLWNLQGQTVRTMRPDVSPISETEAEVCA